MSDADAGCRAVAAAITGLASHSLDPPTPAAVAAAVGLSPEDLEAQFRHWTGVGLEPFLAHLPLTDLRTVMEPSRRRLAGASARLPLEIRVWTPQRSDPRPVIRWGRHPSPFGPVLAATTDAGLCRLGFDGDAAEPGWLAANWPEARLVEEAAATREAVERAFSADPDEAAPPLPVLLRGTAFQIAVWRALVAIPAGAVVGYRDVAATIGQPKAARAVGGAVGANPIAVLVPCHRVVGADGSLAGFAFGAKRKAQLLVLEGAGPAKRRKRRAVAGC